MAYRYLIYSTGTTYAGTIIRESATDNPGAGEASVNTEFIIPEIQPLYLWRVDALVSPSEDLLPNTDSNIRNYLELTTPAPSLDDYLTYSQITGITDTKIDKVTGATENNLAIFDDEGNVKDGGYTIPELTGLTTYTFVGSGSTQIFEDGNEITVYSTPFSGTTVSWGDIIGTLSGQTDLQNALDAKLDITDFNSYTGTTDTRLQGIEDDIDSIDDDIIYLSGQTDTKLATTDFNTYTGATDTRISNIEDDVDTLQSDVTGLTATKLDTTVFNSYTGTSQPILDAALTGVTNLGTGTTLGGTSGRNVTIKSISAVGGVTLVGDANNLIISGETNVSSTWGNIGGTLSDQTDLWNELTGITAETATKLDTAVFDSYTGTTETRLQGIEGDITYLSGETDNRLLINDFNTYSGATDTRIGDIEDDVTALYDESLINITGATNGLSKSGSKDVKLGGTLTEDTTISGTTFDFTVNVDNIKLQSVGQIDIVDTGSNGVNIESDEGIVKIAGNDSISDAITKIEVGESTLLITDDRTIPRGIQYNEDYSSTFQNRSLVDKGYVDAVATGLIPKANVLVATTANITLSGTQTIDGVALVAGDRVLVKDQTTGSENGIYLVTGGTWSRSTDFDDTPDGEVSDGNLIPVLSGNTYANTLWVLVTSDPIDIGTTALEFTLFSSPINLQEGTGIGITGQTIAVDGASLAGNSITWTGNTFNVDITSGTLGTALTDIENDINYISGQTLTISTFNTYTGATETRLEGIEDDIDYISGVTSGLTTTKLDIDTFTGYTATTETTLGNIEDDIDYISGVTDTKLDSDIFTGYTATTAANEIFLVHTGGTELNTIGTTGIDWDVEQVSGSSYSWTGGTDVKILDDGDYEINYNIPFNIYCNSAIIVGANVMLNNTSVINSTSSAGMAAVYKSAGSINLSTAVVSLNADDVLTLGTFRTGVSGSALSAQNGSITIKRKDRLQ